MKEMETFALYGHIAYTPSPKEFVIYPNHYILCRNGKIDGIYPVIPEKYKHIHVYEYKNRLIIPGLCDTHIHAPQYAFRGLGMDMELVEWLNFHAFPEEILYSNIEYAEKAYKQFADALKNSATTRAAIFATSNIPATLLLMELLEETGLCCYVGKVNMDRNAPEELLDKEADISLKQTEDWILKSISKFQRTKPIITPRFVPSCTNKMLSGLGVLARRYRLPVQSHLSENKREIEWVKELCPQFTSYSDVYKEFDLFGRGLPTVMAHCVHLKNHEQDIIKNNGVLISHCPSSNINLTSGIAPVREYLDNGISVSLGSDIAGGFDLSILRAMTDAIQTSKIRAYYKNDDKKPLKASEAFYLGTKGSSPLFGKVGSFEQGYEFDAIVLNDDKLTSPKALNAIERLERCIYLEKDISLCAKFVSGRKII